MKHVLIVILFSLLCIPICAQEAIVYYEGLALYPIDYYEYEFQSLIEPHTQSNPICTIRDSIFLTFIERKLESVEKCVQEGDCIDATIKPTAMIQVIYIKGKYSYYTINLSSFGESKSLTIDGKSYIPDEELQRVIVEIVKFCEKSNLQIPTSKLHAIMKGETDSSNPCWPLILPNLRE